MSTINNIGERCYYSMFETLLFAIAHGKVCLQ